MWKQSIGTAESLSTWRRLTAAIPSVCAICGAWPAQTFCRACVERFAPAAPRCRCCAVRLHPSAGDLCGGCRLHPPPIDRCVAAVAWGWPWSDFIARLKFGRDPGWARPLGDLLVARTRADAVWPDIDLLLPVPLSSARMRARGFNQSLLLAHRLDRCKTAADVLRRIRDVAPQATLNRAGRLTNLRGAFEVAPGGAARVRGRHVALVDDVMTTGATLFEAAAVLRQAGALRVTALVLARNDDAPPQASDAASTEATPATPFGA